jgi:signal peptidase I
LPKIARVAWVVAFVMAGATVIAALAGQISLLPFALIPLIAGIGIVRRRVWSAWGFAVYTFAQLVPIALVVFRTHSRPPGTVGAALLTVFLAPLFVMAGRSLAVAGAPKGMAWPWITLTVLTTLPVFSVQVFVVPTGAMEDTILAGDHILAQRFPRPSLTRGEIVILRYPIDPRQTFIKRIIGLPGDRIRIAKKIVYRNGAALNEPYAVHKVDYEDTYRDDFPSEPNVPLYKPAEEMLEKHVVNGEVVVPAGEYFVLGDNRDQSLDSRYWGFVGDDDLLGKPLMIYDSEDQRTGSIRWGRIFKLL